MTTVVVNQSVPRQPIGGDGRSESPEAVFASPLWYHQPCQRALPLTTASTFRAPLRDITRAAA